MRDLLRGRAPRRPNADLLDQSRLLARHPSNNSLVTTTRHTPTPPLPSHTHQGWARGVVGQITTSRPRYLQQVGEHSADRPSHPRPPSRPHWRRPRRLRLTAGLRSPLTLTDQPEANLQVVRLLQPHQHRLALPRQAHPPPQPPHHHPTTTPPPPRPEPAHRGGFPPLYRVGVSRPHQSNRVPQNAITPSLLASDPTARPRSRAVENSPKSPSVEEILASCRDPTNSWKPLAGSTSLRSRVRGRS